MLRYCQALSALSMPQLQGFYRIHSGSNGNWEVKWLAMEYVCVCTCRLCVLGGRSQVSMTLRLSAAQLTLENFACMHVAGTAFRTRLTVLTLQCI